MIISQQALISISVRLRRVSALVLAIAAMFLGGTSRAADVLTSLDYRIVGNYLKVSPAALAVPKGIAGSVMVELANADGSDKQPNNVLAEGAYVEATLRGPSFPARRLIGQVNKPLMLPAINLAGEYQLDNIRLVDASTGAVRMEGTPSSIPVNVFAELLISRVTSRPLSLQEIQDKGIAIDEANFRAVEFEVGFVLGGNTYPIKFPVVTPDFKSSTEIIPAQELEKRLVQAQAINDQLASRELVSLPPELETAGLNLVVKGCNFELAEPKTERLRLDIPPIPALMVIPGNIGYLNQFFSVQIFTENAAPANSGLSVLNLQARLVLPSGADQIPAPSYEQPGDDPLRFARVGPDKIIQPVQSIVRPGPDGTVGTADDILRLYPHESGQAEFLVEGLREGLHVMNLELFGDLDGLSSGLIKIKGKAAGSVLVRNPKFSLTFSHPRTVRTGEEYDAFVTILNTSQVEANLVSVALPKGSVSGATILSSERVELGNISPGQSATARFHLRGERTGQIRFSNLTTGEDSVTGRFRLTMGVDERGVELSPDSIGYPDYVDKLPSDLFYAANRVLGQALSVYSAPLLPPGVLRIPWSAIQTRVLELAEAGQRVAYGEPLARVLPDIALDWQGGRKFNEGFDQIMTTTDAGRQWRAALFNALENAGTGDPTQILEARAADLAGRGEAWAFMSANSTLLRPVFTSASNTADLNIASAPQAGGFPGTNGNWLVFKPRTGSVRWEVTSPVAQAELGLLIVQTNGTGEWIRWSIPNPQVGGCYKYSLGDSTHTLLVDELCDGSPEQSLVGIASAVSELPPELLLARQLPEIESVRPRPSCYPGAAWNYGTVLGVLFSKPMSETNVSIPSAYSLENGVTAGSVRLQPGGRVALLNLRQGVGSIRPRTLKIQGVTDPRGHAIVNNSRGITNLISEGAAVSGRVLRADGSPAANIPVTLTMNDLHRDPFDRCDQVIGRITQVFTDTDGRFTMDFILAGVPYTISATDTGGLPPEAIDMILKSYRGGYFDRDRLLLQASQTNFAATLGTSNLTQAIALAENLDRAVWNDTVPYADGMQGQEIAVALRFRGRGTVSGQIISADGVTPAVQAAVNLIPDPASRELVRGVFADNQGRFQFNGIPLGQFTIQVKTSLGQFRTVAGVLSQVGETAELRIELTAPTPKEILRTTVRGVVTESDNMTPHNRAQVFIRGPDGVVGVAESNDSGYWEINDVPVDTYFVTAISQDGKRKGERTGVQASAGAITYVNIALQGTTVVAGRVENSSGQPVANALVAGGSALVKTDSNGLFTLAGVPIGFRRISAGLEAKYAPNNFPRLGSESVEALPGVTNFVVIRLHAAGVIAGQVRDANGFPVSGINAAIPVEKGFLWTKVDQNGFFKFINIPPGEYIVSAPAPPVRKTAEELEELADNGSDEELMAAIQDAFASYAGVNTSTNFNPGTWGYTTTTVLNDGHTAPADVRYFPVGSVSGIVVNDQAVPIGARVRLTGLGMRENGSPGFMVRGDRDSDAATGEFLFSNVLTVGDWGVQAASPFYTVVLSTSGRTTDSFPNVTNLVMQFPPRKDTHGRLTGRVVYPDGTPVGKDVEVTTYFGPGIVNTTDTNGFFDNQMAIPSRSYTVEARDPVTGYRGRVMAQVAAGLTNFVQVPLLGLGHISVSVFQANGLPAGKAFVQLYGSPFSEQREGETGTNGLYQTQDLVPGSYQLLVRYTSGSTTLEKRMGLDVKHNQVTSANIVLGGTGSVRGTFSRLDGQPIVGARIAVGRVADVPTDAQGQFLATGVPLGTYRVVATDPVTGRSAVANATLTYVDQVVTVPLTEQLQGIVRGQVFQQGKSSSIAGAEVSLQSRDGLASYRSATTGPDGSYEFPGVTPGDYMLSCRLQGLNGGVVQNVSMPANAPTLVYNLTLPAPEATGQVFVKVVQPDGVTPAVGVRVLASTIGGGTKDTGPDGTALFEGLKLGGVFIKASSLSPAETFNVAITNVAITSSAPSNSVVARMQGVGAVSGQVFNSTGLVPVPFATLSVEFLSQPFAGTKRGNLVSDGEGKFTIPNIPVGEYRLVAASQALAATTNGVISGHHQTNFARLTLAPSGVVIGRVLRADGVSAVSSNNVLLRFSSQTSAAGVSVVPTDENGRFGFTNVPLGGFTLDVAVLTVNGLIKTSGFVLANEQVVDLGDLLLDEAMPLVTSITPANTSNGVPIISPVDIVFSEPMLESSVNGNTNGIYLRSPTRLVPVSVQLLAHPGDGLERVARLTPFAPLSSMTTYEVVVISGERRDAVGTIIATGPTDRVGRYLPQLFVSTFTTRDDDPPLLVSMAPAPGAIQVDPLAAMRLTFNEPLRNTNIQFTLSGPSGAVAGSLNLSEDGKILAFTPNAPLLPNRTYSLVASNLIDLAGNRFANEPLAAAFSTLDTVGPVVATLRLNGQPVAGASVPVEAILAEPEAGASVRFLKEAEPVALAATNPYIAYVTMPTNGSVRLQAIATDQFGNDGEITQLEVTVVSNTPPLVTLIRMDPTNGPVGTSKTLSFQLSADDDNAVTNITLVGLGAVQAVRNFDSGTPTNLTFTVPATNLASSFLQFRAQSTDSLGAKSVEAVLDYVLEDKTLPELTFLQPTKDQVVNPLQPLDLEFAISDNSSNLAVKVQLSNLISMTAETNFLVIPNLAYTNRFRLSVTNALQNGGSIQAQISVTDTAGNVRSEGRSFRVPDVTPPAITSVDPTNGTLRASLWEWTEWRFSEAVKTLVPITNVVTMTNELGDSGFFVIDQSTASFRTRPTRGLRPGVTYTNLLFPGIIDSASNVLVTASGAPIPVEGIASTFRTAAILSQYPTNGALLVAGQRLVSTINYERGLNATWFGFRFGTNQLVSANVSQNSTNAAAQIFAPTNTGPAEFSVLLANVSNFSGSWTQAPVLVEIRPRDLDDDNDGWINGFESDRGMNPFVADLDANDFDQDGLSNGQERTLGTDPGKADSDDDGLNDGLEIAGGTNPLNPDSDDDGLPDGVDPAPLTPSGGIEFAISTPITLVEGETTNLQFSVTSSNAPLNTLTFGGTNVPPIFATLGGITFTNSATNGAAYGELRLRPLLLDAGTYVLTIKAAGILGSNSVAGSTNITVVVLDNPSFPVTRWKDPADGNFSDTNRWTDGVPSLTKPGLIDAAGTYTVSLNNDSTIGELIVGGTSGSQTLRVSGRALTVNGSLQVRGTGRLSLHSSGQLTGPGAITIASRFDWTGGVIQGNGTLNLLPGAFTDVSGADWKYHTARTINNAGTMVIRGTGGMNVASLATLNNSGLIDVQADIEFSNASGGFATISTWNNTGTFRKSAGLGKCSMGPLFNNRGTVLLESGTLELWSGGESSGAFNLSQDTVLRWAGGTYVMGAPSRLQGAGSVQFAGGTQTNLGTLSISGELRTSGGISTFGPGANIAPIPRVTLGSGFGRLEFNSGNEVIIGNLDLAGNLRGTDLITVTNAFNWSTGTHDGSGATRVLSNAVFNLSGTEYKNLIGRVVQLEGQGTWTGTGGWTIGGKAQLKNYGVFEIQNNSTISTAVSGSSTDGFILNYGLLTKVASTGITEFGPALANYGQLEVQTGTLRLDAGATNTGAFHVQSNATLRVASGNHVLSAESSIEGEGLLSVAGGVFQIDGAYQIATFIDNGTLRINSQQAWITNSMIFDGGVIEGDGILHLNGTFDWKAGSMRGAGTTVIGPSAVARLINTGSNKFLNRVMENQGLMEMQDGVTLHLNNGTLLNGAGATIQVPNSATFSWNGSSNVIRNNGTIRKGGAGILTFGGSVPFQNTGLLDVLSGNCVISGNGTNSGIMQISAGASLEFTGNYSYTAESVIGGGGNFTFSGGTHDMLGSFLPEASVLFNNGTITLRNNLGIKPSIQIGSGTVRFNAPQTLSTLAMSNSGTLEGTSEVAVTDTLTWGRGFMSGTGRTTIRPGGRLLVTNGSGPKYLQRVLENFGAITVTESTTIYCQNGVLQIRLGATMDILDGLILLVNSGNSTYLENAGTITLSGTNLFTLSGAVVLNNTGVIEAQSGTLTLSGGGTNAGSIFIRSNAFASLTASMTHPAGSYLGGAGEIRFTGGTHNLLGNFQPVGVLSFRGGTVTVNNAIHPRGSLLVTNTGTLNFQSPQVLGRLEMHGSGLGGSADVTITNEMIWTGGTLSGGGRTMINPGAVLRLGSGSGSKILSRNLENSGTVEIPSPESLYFQIAVFNNLPGGVVNTMGGEFRWIGNSGSSIRNLGVWNKTATNTLEISTLPFHNNGALNLLNGTMTMNFGGTNRGAINIATNATLSYLGSTVYAFEPGTAFSGQGNLLFQGNGNIVVSTNLDFGTLQVVFRNGASLVGAYELANTPGGTLTFDRSMTIPGSLRVGGRLVTTTSSIILTINGNLELANGSFVDNPGQIQVKGDYLNHGATITGNDPVDIAGAAPSLVQIVSIKTASGMALSAANAGSAESLVIDMVWSGDPGITYAVEMSRDFVNWTECSATVTESSPGKYAAKVIVPRAAVGFFRTRTE